MGLDLVAVPPPVARAREVARVLELDDDALHGALGDPYLLGDVPDPAIRIPGDAQEDVRVIGQEGPRNLGRPWQKRGNLRHMLR